MKIPSNRLWKQLNISDIFGPIFSSKNINLDLPGYASLSPRAVRIYSEEDNNDFGNPLSFGRVGQGQFLIATSDKVWELTLGNLTFSITEENGSGAPSLAFGSYATWWQNRWYVSLATSVKYRTAASDTYSTVPAITLTSGFRHPLCVLKTLNRLAIGNKNEIFIVDSGHNLLNTIVLPTDFEVLSISYNNGKLGIITRLGSDNDAQEGEAYFFTADGSTNAAGQGVGIGSLACLSESNYKSTFLIFLKDGRVIYWNGGGIEEYANLPFVNRPGMVPEGNQNIDSYGDSAIPFGPTRVLVNLSTRLSERGARREYFDPYSPSGVHCFDKDAGLYHRFSPSISPMTQLTVAAAGVNPTTDVLTKTTGTIPPTGSALLYTDDSGTGITGISKYTPYYLIKESDTTFKIATSRANAEEGIAVDITGASDGTAYMYVVDLIDFGQTFYDLAAGIARHYGQGQIYRDILIGGDFCKKDDVSSDWQSLCTVVPYLENRGEIIFSRVVSDGLEDQAKEFTVFFLPLANDDAIVIKHKPREVYGLPVSNMQDATLSDEGVWKSRTQISTQVDLSVAKAYLDEEDRNELEIDIEAGAGAGSRCQVRSIDYDSDTGVYSITLEEEIIGASADRECYFSLDNWHHLQTITAADEKENRQGYVNVGIGEVSKSQFLKVELRGWQTTIEYGDLTKAIETESEE